MRSRDLDPMTTSEFIENFRICRDFHADHFGNQILRVRLYFHKDMDQILFWPFSIVCKRSDFIAPLFDNCSP
jgi:hypothetical protein